MTPLRYRGSCSHRIRRKMVTPEATFFVLLFHLSSILSFYHKYNPSPPLENYKRGGKEDNGQGHETDRNTHLSKSTHTSPEETWDLFLLSKACNPYYEHSDAKQHKQQQNSLDVVLFLPQPVYTLVSALHTIRV
jgi:hypothetical protein